MSRASDFLEKCTELEHMRRTKKLFFPPVIVDKNGHYVADPELTSASINVELAPGGTIRISMGEGNFHMKREDALNFAKWIWGLIREDD